jgi:hypothetical protein
VAACPGLQLTPKVSVRPGKPDKKGVKVTLTCSFDCTYTVLLDTRRLTGQAIGGIPKPLLFKGVLLPGRHIVRANATAVVNAGPPGSASTSFRSR